MNIDIKEPDNFLMSYFGDYWEGKNEQDFIDEAISESESSYLATVLKSFAELLKQDIQWKEYLGKLNIFVDDDAKGKAWVENVFMMLQKRSKHRL